jgi:cell division septum initiation protein DivIVA
MTVTRQTLHNLLFNHGVENNELLDALAWKFAKLMDEHDAVRAERDRLCEALQFATAMIDSLQETVARHVGEIDRLREILRLTQTYEKYASAALAKEAGQ